MEKCKKVWRRDITDKFYQKLPKSILQKKKKKSTYLLHSAVWYYMGDSEHKLSKIKSTEKLLVKIKNRKKVCHCHN